MQGLIKRLGNFKYNKQFVFVKLIHWDILKRNHWMFTEPDRQSLEYF